MKSSTPAPMATVDAQHPWLGLVSFTEDTRGFFHGREEEVAELGRRVQRKLLTVLFGQSGLGKTSILQAGLVPRLRPEGFCPVYVRLDYDPHSPPPSEQIKRAVFRATEAAGTWTRSGTAVEGESLWEFLHHRDDVLRDAAGRTLTPILIFDQFEEIFTLAQGDDAGRKRASEFLADLADLVENRPPAALEVRIDRDETDAAKFDFARADYRILISLREDYLAHLEGLKDRMPSVTQNRMRLARMTGAQALAAVRRPAAELVSEPVAEAIVRFVAGGADLAVAEVEPSLLSLICRELNNARLAQGRDEISADLLAGSRDTILAEFYGRALADQPAGVRIFIEDELLTDSGFRESVAEERVRKGFAAAGAATGALAQLVDRRLLRVEDRLDQRRVEITHDVLCSVIAAGRVVRREREALEESQRQLAAQREGEESTRRSLVRARLVAAVACVLLLMATGSAVFGWLSLRRARVAEAVAGQERDRAQLSRSEAEKLVTFLLDDLHAQLEPTGRIEIVSGLARRALAYFDSLPPESRDARSERYRALALGRLGSALTQQGKTLEAEKPLHEAEQLLTTLLEGADRDAETTAALAAVLRHQGRNAYMQNRFGAGVTLAQRSVAVIEPVATAPGAPAAARLELGRTLMAYGFVLMRDQQLDEAKKNLGRAREVLQRLSQEAGYEVRAGVVYAETCAWELEAAEQLGREEEFAPLLDEALALADRLVEREAGNLGALRSRALLRTRRVSAAMDRFDYSEAASWARRQAADWDEFLRFDPTNDTARNNRRVARASVASALYFEGKLDAALEMARVNLQEVLREKGSPSTARNTAGGMAGYIYLEAELGREASAEALLAESDRLRQMSAGEVDPESYFRFSLPLWGDMRRADMLFRLGRTEEARALGRSVERKARELQTDSAGNAANQRQLRRNAQRLEVQAALRARDWEGAMRAARELLAGRPEASETGRDSAETLAGDRIWAAVAMARAGDRQEAKRHLQAGAEFVRGLRAAGATDHSRSFELALVGLAEGLLAEESRTARVAFTNALAEIAAMPPQPQQLRSVRELREVLQGELARLAAG